MKRITEVIIFTALSMALIACTNVRSDYLISTSLKFSNEEGTPLVTVTPDYPRLAVSQQLEGSVAMSFMVGDSGEVEDILVIDSPGEPFESAAVKALQQAVYDSSLSGKGYVAIAEFVLSDRNIY
ncbi:MAG: TonB family protein [Cellvibrionaceae bacterium]